MKNHIAIIGGGIGGVATAVALQHFGIRATIYERAPELREAGAGMMLWPNATRVLRELGVLDELIPRGGLSTNFLVRAQDGRVLMDIPLGDFDVPALCVRRADLLETLLRSLPAASIRLGHEFSHVDQHSASVHLHFANGECTEHTGVIGADGIRSRVRSQILGKIAPIDRGYTLWRGIARYDGVAIGHDSNSETWGRGHRFGILSTGHHRVTWYATGNRNSRVADRSECDLLATFQDWHEPVLDLIRATETVLCHPALDLAPLRRWSTGRVALLGDAAHPCTPNLGQGCCMALEDAMVIAKCVAKETSIASAFERYEILRRPRTSHIQQRSLLMGRIGQWENAALVAGRSLVTNLLPAGLLEYNLRRVYSYQTSI
jgi:2-polyprenyl-6-methoxyphenol hydroxylase-like FAD-dependent oxidoreductase